MTKRCPSCGQVLQLDHFYRQRRGDGVTVYCKRCAIEQTVRRQRQLKAQAIAYKGGGCQRCGYDRCYGALEFHHRDPSQKDFSLGQIGTTEFEKVKSELEKCDLLCANCHREAHAGDRRQRSSPQTTGGDGMTKRCPSCKELLPLTAFYTRSDRPQASSFCKACMHEQSVRRQRGLKEQAIAYKGSCCQRCRYDRYAGSLEFHHRDPSQKDVALSQVKMKKFELVKDELDKCDLLCVNCHREVHSGLTE